MTIADEATEALARDEAAVTLARETVALLRDLAARNEAAAEQADVRLAGRTMAPLPVAHDLINESRKIAAAARGQAATP